MMPLLVNILFFLLGAILGAAANFLIYHERMEPRPISPWMRRNQSCGTDCQSARKTRQVGNLPHVSIRRWFDYVPIIGWLGLRREASIFGTGFWVRPFLVELLMGIGVAALYQYEMQGGLLPAGFPPPTAIIPHQFAAHVVLIFFMLVASLIDVDETIIPDSITISGTLIGLAIAAILPQSLLPDVFPNAAGVLQMEFLRLTSPNDWVPSLDSYAGLSIGLACWLLWCFALLPRTWYSRHGWRRALQLCVASVCRERFSLLIFGLAILGTATITFAWHHGGNHWIGLLTAMVGMAAGGGVVWAVRILGSAALKKEAMGFGDVTLLAMIGAFLGWQAILIVFFIAPFATIVIGLFRLIFQRQNEIPYGPFLCLATLATVLYWAPIWERTWLTFSLGWILPLVLAGCFALMPPMLYGVRRVLSHFGRGG
jgi:prepilin signal peptidase PulO-like enzyme (type II secretory pathway)